MSAPTATRTTTAGNSLLIRRNNTGELAFYLCWAPAPVTLAQLVRVAGVRWIVEESFLAGKGQAGLDQYQVRRWTSGRRFTTLVLAALAVLAICTADARTADRPARPVRASSPGVPGEEVCFGTGAIGHWRTRRHDGGGSAMSFTDKVKNKAEELAGKAKQGVGEATDNERLFAEGQAQESAAHAKQAGEHAKDAGRNVRDALS